VTNTVNVIRIKVVKRNYKLEVFTKRHFQVVEYKELKYENEVESGIIITIGYSVA